MRKRHFVLYSSIRSCTLNLVRASKALWWRNCIILYRTWSTNSRVISLLPDLFGIVRNYAFATSFYCGFCKQLFINFVII